MLLRGRNLLRLISLTELPVDAVYTVMLCTGQNLIMLKCFLSSVPGSSIIEMYLLSVLTNTIVDNILKMFHVIHTS